MRDGCPFCEYAGPSEIVRDYGEVYVIEPLSAVCDGHVIVIPKRHVEHIASDLKVSTAALLGAARYVREFELEHVNVIVSKGRYATQTVLHLHVHVVPREDGDGLMLPWGIYGQGHTIR